MFVGSAGTGLRADGAGRRHRLRHGAQRPAAEGHAGARADHARRQARRAVVGGGAAGDQLRAERSARGRAGDLRHRGQAALRRSRALHRRVREGSRARRDHRQRAAQGLQHRHRRRLPGRHRHLPRRAQRLSVRDQPGGREVGLADVERGPRSERELGRHLGRRHAHRRGRLVRRDRDSVQDAEVRPRGDADLGHQLPAPAAPQEREQLLVAAAPHSPAVARVDGRHLRRPAGPEAGRQRPRQAVRARQPQQAAGGVGSTRTTTPAST